MKKVVLVGVSDSRNNGCWLMLAAAVQGIRRLSPVPVKFTCFTSKLSIDEHRYRTLNIDVLVYPWTRLNIRKINVFFRWCCFFVMPLYALLLRLMRSRTSRLPFWKAMIEADLIIDLSGDSLSADYPEFALATSALPLVLARILRKKYMLCAQSIGPFRATFINKILVALIRDADLVTTRERITDGILSLLHIHGNVVPLQDLSFSVSPAGKERIQEICKTEGVNISLPLVGFAVSDLISSYAFKDLSATDKKRAYIETMAAFADWIVESYDMRILFIPHVVIPKIGNDLIVSKEIVDRMRNRDKSYVISGTYLGDELKGLIGLCKYFVGSRMHATLSALSQKIPTLTYVYNHKAIGINGDILGQHEYLIDIRKMSPKGLLEKSKEVFQLLISNAQQISNLLESILPKIVESSEANLWAAINLFEIAGPLRYMNDPRTCTGCGTCTGVCRSRAIQMQYTKDGTLRPRFIKKCSECGRCFKVCPPLGFVISHEEKFVFGAHTYDPEVGVVIGAYKGYAKDQRARWGGASGGLVTSILAHLFDTEQVDAVLTVMDDPKMPLRPKGVWVSDAGELPYARGSKYTPVAPLEALRDLPPYYNRLAFVGLPCHLWGLRLLEKNGFLKGRQVALRIGLFCGSTPSGHAVEFMLHKNDIQPHELVRISYRGEGWPGGLKIHLKNGVQFFYPQEEIWPLFSSPYFYNLHCYFCQDFFSHLADLSFGDAWLPECQGDPEGWSLCLVRSKVGVDVLDDCHDKVYLEEIPISRVKEAMKVNIQMKYQFGILKESIFPLVTAVRMGADDGLYSFSTSQRLAVRYEYFLSCLGKSRIFQYRCLDYPFNRFMRFNRRILSVLKGISFI